MISGVPDEHTDTLSMLNRKCTVSILNGALADRNDNQRELPLGEGGPVEREEEDAEAPATLQDALAEEEEATMGVIARQIARSEVKKKQRARKRK